MKRQIWSLCLVEAVEEIEPEVPRQVYNVMGGPACLCRGRVSYFPSGHKRVVRTLSKHKMS